MRKKHNSSIYYLFKQTISETSTTNEIENATNQIGIPFLCDVKNVIKAYRDAMSGKVYQTTTTKTLVTDEQLDFQIGDKVSRVNNPSDTNKEMIQQANPLEKLDRGNKYRSTPIYEWTIEVS
jgi:hypothetical protein